MWNKACIENLCASLTEGAQSLEDTSGFIYEGQEEQFIRDVREAVVQLKQARKELG